MTQEQHMNIESNKEDPFKKLEQQKLDVEENKTFNDDIVVANNDIEDDIFDEDEDEDDVQQNGQLEEKKKSYKLENFEIIMTREENGCIHEGIYPKDYVRKCEIILIDSSSNSI